jgi:undecaprenyl-diphosphatase
MINLILNFDKFITLFLKNLTPHNYFFDLFFSFFSLKGNAIFVWILVIIIALIFEERKNPGLSKKDKQFVITFISTFLLTTLTVFILQNFFHRLRPITTSFNQFQLVLTKCPTSFSFPSGHAATAFAAATVLTFFDKKRRFFYYLIAFLIAYSRIYLGCHYFLDVFFGAIIGFSLSQFFLKIIALDQSRPNQN